MPSLFVKQVARARRAARQRGLRADLSLSQWLQTRRDFDGKCAYCGERSWTIDHFVSMAQGGPTSVDFSRVDSLIVRFVAHPAWVEYV